MLKGKTVVLGVSGSIAAYKIAYLASSLKKLHASVQVIMTKHATEFITPVTFESLTDSKCLVDTFDRNFEFSVEHVAWPRRRISLCWLRPRPMLLPRRPTGWRTTC